MSGELAVTSQALELRRGFDHALSIVQERTKFLKRFVREIVKEGVHWQYVTGIGAINKKGKWEPTKVIRREFIDAASSLLRLYLDPQVQPEFSSISDTLIRFAVKTNVVDITGAFSGEPGTIIASYLGSANSNEDRFGWRWEADNSVKVPEEYWDAKGNRAKQADIVKALADEHEIKARCAVRKIGGKHCFALRVANDNIANLEHTILVMAIKRANMNALRLALGLSSAAISQFMVEGDPETTIDQSEEPESRVSKTTYKKTAKPSPKAAVAKRVGTPATDDDMAALRLQWEAIGCSEEVGWKKLAKAGIYPENITHEDVMDTIAKIEASIKAEKEGKLI